MASTSTAAAISSKDGYRVWAQTYDSAPNPMLSLEQRILEAILPKVHGLDVIDLGCGTGRWLAELQKSGPRSLLGVDSSPEMLQVARSKLGNEVALLNADCMQLALPPASADLVLGSFLLSYVDDAAALLEKITATLRPNGCVVLTDLHPDTTARLNWRRGVHREDGFREIRTFHRSFQELIEICKNANLDIQVCLQPRFADPERAILRAVGKEEYFERIKDYPAIYVLQLRPRTGVAFTRPTPNAITSIRRARLAFDAQSSAIGDLKLERSRIASIRDNEASTPSKNCAEAEIDLSGFVVFPGLVNAHDHLEFALFPRLGRSNYKNFLEWADDIHRPDASPVFEHRQVPRAVRLWWGGIRNLLSGVTTVCQHNPYEAAVFEDDFIVRVVREYGWAHSLPMDSEFAPKKQATPEGQPFLIHLGEGIDERSAREIFELHQSGALDEDTVLIHGLALDSEGKKLLRSTGSGLIWCPSSNIFLFGQTHSSCEVQEFTRVALGNDSPLTAQGDLLDELRFAHEFIGAPAEKLHSYVLQGAAELLCLKNGEGSFRVGAWADLVAVRDTGGTPAGMLAALSHANVELVLLGGCVQLASAEMVERLPDSATVGLQPLQVEGSVRWIRAPLRWLFAETRKHLGEEIRLGGKRVRLAN